MPSRPEQLLHAGPFPTPPHPTPPEAGQREGLADRVEALTPAHHSFSSQVEGSPSLRWQMALYRGLPGREEDADNPEKIVRRVQEVSAVLYHLEQVGSWQGLTAELLSYDLQARQGAGLMFVGRA